MGVYKVWDPHHEGSEANAKEISDTPDGTSRRHWALDAENAAEVYADRYFADRSYPDEVTVCVRSPDGTLSRWCVTVQMVPSFSATEVTEAEVSK
jgi:hypothetical protein